MKTINEKIHDIGSCDQDCIFCATIVYVEAGIIDKEKANLTFDF